MIQYFMVNVFFGGLVIGQKGMKVWILGGQLMNIFGNIVSGNVQVDFVEIYDKVIMVLFNKLIMGIQLIGDKGILVLKGEYYLCIMQNGQEFNVNNVVYVQVFVENILGLINGMFIWIG